MCDVHIVMEDIGTYIMIQVWLRSSRRHVTAWVDHASILNLVPTLRQKLS